MPNDMAFWNCTSENRTHCLSALTKKIKIEKSMNVTKWKTNKNDANCKLSANIF